MPHDQPAELHGAEVNDWISVVRRARIGRTTKYVALMVATYADPDGTHVFPGVARLVVQCEMRPSAVRKALADLRRAGLIERVRQGNRRRGKSDEYRLTFSADLLERIDVPTPEAERAAIDQLQQDNAGASSARQLRSRLHSNGDHSLCDPKYCTDLRHSDGVEDLRQNDGTGSDLRQSTGVENERSTPPQSGVDDAIYATTVELSTPRTEPPPSIDPPLQTDPPSQVVALGAQPQDAREAEEEPAPTPPAAGHRPCKHTLSGKPYLTTDGTCRHDCGAVDLCYSCVLLSRRGTPVHCYRHTPTKATA